MFPDEITNEFEQLDTEVDTILDLEEIEQLSIELDEMIKQLPEIHDEAEE